MEENSTFPNQSRGQRLTTRGGGEGGRTSRRRVWPSPTTFERSIADPDVLGTEFYSISASKRRMNAVNVIFMHTKIVQRIPMSAVMPGYKSRMLVSFLNEDSSFIRHSMRVI